MGMAKLWPPNDSKTAKRISMKLQLYNYITGTTTHANPWGAVRTWMVLANMWLVQVVTCCSFLVNRFCLILQLTHSPHGSTDFDALYVVWCVSAQGSTFLGPRWDCCPFRGSNPSKTPILGAWIGVVKPKSQNVKTCILSKLMHRFQPNFAQR